MAVLKESDGVVKITNGDLAALKEIKEKYGLKDESAVIVFAIGVLSQAGGRPVTIIKDDGAPLRLIPSDQLKAVE